MILRKDIVETARTFMGTPWHHIGRVGGPMGGMDCFGLIVLTGRKMEYPVKDLKVYTRAAQPELLLKTMDKSFDRIPINEIGIGDIPVFWVEKKDTPRHMGIMTPYGVIHTLQKADDSGKVVEHRIDQFWDKRLCYAFKFRGVEPVGDMKLFPSHMPVTIEEQMPVQFQGGCCG